MPFHPPTHPPTPLPMSEKSKFCEFLLIVISEYIPLKKNPLPCVERSERKSGWVGGMKRRRRRVMP